MDRFNYSFEKWLENYFINLNEVGGIAITKDNCEDMFDNWIEKMDMEHLFNLGTLYGKEQYMAGESYMGDKMLQQLKQRNHEKLTTTT